MSEPPILAADAARLRLQRQRLRRRVMVFFYSVLLLFLAASIYMAFGPKPPPKPKFIAVTPQRAAAATHSIDAVRQALTQALPGSVPPSPVLTPAPATRKSLAATAQARAHQAPPPPSAVQVTHEATGEDVVTMRVSQADLNAYLSGNAKVKAMLLKKGVRQISVELAQPDNVTILAAAVFRGIPGNAEVDAALSPDPVTAIRMKIMNARFARFPPVVIKAAASQIIAYVFGGNRHPLPLKVTTVKVIGTDLVLTGVRRPPSPPKS